MKLRTVSALIFVFVGAALALAAPVRQEADEFELVARLCGKLGYVDRIPDKINPVKYSEDFRPLKGAKLIAYERRGNPECCTSVPVAAETSTDKSGAFEFKGLPPGYYWFVAVVDQKEHVIPIVLKKTQDKQPVCSQMSFAIEDSGKFVLRVRSPKH